MVQSDCRGISYTDSPSAHIYGCEREVGVLIIVMFGVHVLGAVHLVVIYIVIPVYRTNCWLHEGDLSSPQQLYNLV